MSYTSYSRHLQTGIPGVSETFANAAGPHRRHLQTLLLAPAQTAVGRAALPQDYLYRTCFHDKRPTPVEMWRTKLAVAAVSVDASDDLAPMRSEQLHRGCPSTLGRSQR